MTDWPSEIAIVVLIQQQLMKVEDIWDFHLPEVAAGETELRRVEERIGSRLPPEYRGFLAAANGWTSVMQDNDLWPASVLTDPRAMPSVRDCVNTLVKEGVCPELAHEPNDWLLIGGSFYHPDVFLIALERSRWAGEVRWLSSSEVDRYPDFREFFLTLADYNRFSVKNAQESQQTGDGAGDDSVTTQVR